jgi:zinc protease
MLGSSCSKLALVAAGLVYVVPLSPAAAQPAVTPATQAQASGLPADPAVRSGVLSNGMRYSIMRNATPPRNASLRLHIGAGSLHEAENQRGIAHFLEHMVLNGTTNVPEGEFVRRLERHGLRFGPDTNASTGFERTVYKLDLPQADAATVDTALFLLREVVDEATLATSAIDAERGIVLSEERTRSTPAYRTLVDQIGFMLSGQLAPNRLPIGLTETISTAPRERFVEFYHAYYRPERATLIAVGDFDVDEMERKIRAQFDTWRAEGPAGADPDLGVVAQRGVEARVRIEPGSAERVSLSWLRAPDHRPDTRAIRADKLAERIALQILDRRLERIAAVAETAPFISASTTRADQARSAEVVQVSATFRPDEWRPALRAIEQEQRRLVEHGVTDAEVARQLGQIRTALTTAVARAATRRSSDLANRIADAIDDESVFTAPTVDLAVFEEAASGLTRERIERAARELFRGNGPLLYMSGARPVAGGEASLRETYVESRAQAAAAPDTAQAAAWPYTDFGAPGRVAERREINGAIDATLVRFANGVRLTVKQTNFADDEIMVVVRTGDGRGNIPAEGPSPQWVLGTGFVLGGLGRIGFEDMRDVLSSRSVGARALLYDESFALLGRTRPEDFETQLQMLAAYVADPGWNPSGWNRIRAQADTMHARYEATPGGIYEREAAGLLHDGDRRWATPSREEMTASDISIARDLLADAFAREPIEVIIIGDIGVDEAIARTAATFGALPERIPEPDTIVPPRFPAGTPTPVRLTHSGRADQGLAQIAWPTMGQYRDSAGSRALSVLTSVFRLRLTERIREEQGATYSPVASQVTSPYFDDFGFMFGRIEAPPELLERFLADAADIARDLAENPISEDELERARRPMVEGVRRSRNSNGYWQYALARIQEDARVAEAIRTEQNDYEQITPESLRETARRFLRPDAAWKLMIEPRSLESSH